MATIPRIGTEFATFRIEALIGRGGMSVVYRAENPRLGTKVALKILAADLSEDEAFRERFVRESRLAAAINHPNIVTIYDAGEWEGALYIAMRYVHGDLRGLLQREGALSPERTAGVISQAGAALDAAHSEGLVHRDVKPANILIEHSAGPDARELVYLADFGLTKHGESRGATATGQFLGTIDYMAPEQIEGRTVDARTDIYSLGCVLVECLTGQPPYPRETEAAALWAHMQEPPPRVSERRPSLPAAVDAVVERVMAKRPEDRFASVSELVTSLREALGEDGSPRRRERPGSRGRIVQSGAPSAGRPEAHRQRRGIPMLATLLLLGLAAGAGIAGGLLLPRSKSTDTVVRTATVSPPPSKFSAFDQALLSSIPQAFRATCVHRPPIAEGFDATLSCRPGNGALRASYSHARSNPYMNDEFRRRVENAGYSLNPAEQLPVSGACNVNSTSVTEWLVRGATGHEQASRYVLSTTSTIEHSLLQGHVLCFDNKHRSWIEWTNDRAAIFAAAFGPTRSRSRLLTWWETDAGPLG